MSAEHGGIVADLPDDLRDWLRSQAAERDIEETELLRQLLTTYQSVNETDLEEVLSAEKTNDAVEAVATFEEHLQDVRNRVIQVKRETDTKAPIEHDHPDLAASVEDISDRVEGGFANFEAILTEFNEVLSELEGHVSKLASAMVVSRRTLDEVRAAHRRRARVESLKDAAAAAGSRSAKCEACGEKVDLSLLVEPSCPHCDRPASDVMQRSGFFRSNLLTVGDHPALVGETIESKEDAASHTSGHGSRATTVDNDASVEDIAAGVVAALDRDEETADR